MPSQTNFTETQEITVFEKEWNGFPEEKGQKQDSRSQKIVISVAFELDLWHQESEIPE